VTRLAQGLFAALLLATFAAFFVAQRLKSTPPRIQGLGVVSYFSPNRDGRFDQAPISFRLKRGDVVDVAILDADGDAVRQLVQGRSVGDGERVRAVWDGLDDDGRRAHDGTYRPRLVLRRQGRSLVLPRNIRLDTTPPRPRVLSIGPEQNLTGPELLPRRDGAAARIRFFAPGRRPSVEIWRTDGPEPRRVDAGLPRAEVDRNGVGRTEWDGTIDGEPAPAGTYVAVVRSRDQAGNIGQSASDRLLQGRPRPGELARGRGGITVRYVAVQPPVLPVRAGETFTVGVDARGATYNWSLRKVGATDPIRRSRRSAGGPLERGGPGRRAESGLFLFEARTRTRATRVPVAVDDRRGNRVLVVLPASTWQGRNRIDDDGDGFPNTLERGTPVRLERVYAGGGLPRGLARNEAPLLAHLARQGLRFDLTTDVALALGSGPRIRGHRGVLLAGDTVWLTEDVRRSLRAFVVGGGTLASLGTGSLRREVRQTPRRRLVAPTPAAPADLFGARLDPVRRRSVDLSIIEDHRSLQLFAGGEGLFPDVAAWEATRAWPEARVLSSAGTPDGLQTVIVGARFGRGLVVRTGVPDFPTRLSGDVASAELIGRIWTLLRTG
jgi:flagellar hook assembly protein FlgD